MNPTPRIYIMNLANLAIVSRPIKDKTIIVITNNTIMKLRGLSGSTYTFSTSANSLILILAVHNKKPPKSKEKIKLPHLPKTRSAISIIFLFGKRFSNRYRNIKAKIAINTETRVIYHPAVPTISTRIAGLVKKVFAKIVITNRLIASWYPKLPSLSITLAPSRF
jgi:hypothetical protein